MTTLPCVIADDLNEEQIKAFRLADNKVSEVADWDMGLLGLELKDLVNWDMSDFGFDFTGDDTDDKEAEEDNYEAKPKKDPVSKVGDIYQLGEHRLMCGDSTKKDDVDKLLEGVKVDLLLTDPPYGIDIVNKDGHVGNGCIAKVNDYEPIVGDDTTLTAMNSYIIGKEVSNNQIIFGGNYFTDFLLPSMCWLVWDKENGDTYFADVELAWTSFNRAARMYHYTWNGMIREGSKEVEGKTRVHPTQKPVGLMGKILKDFTTDNDTVLDMFGGSGSTLIACEQLKRKCYIMELSPGYVDTIIERWETFTGNKAEKIA